MTEDEHNIQVRRVPVEENHMQEVEHDIDQAMVRVKEAMKKLNEKYPLMFIPQWISVKDKLPEKQGEYLIYCKTEWGLAHHLHYFYPDDKTFDCMEFCRTTHWMDLPEAPEVEG